MIIFKDLEKNPLFLHTAMPEEKSTLDKEHFKNQESEWTKEDKEIELTRRTCQMKGIVLSNINIGFKKHCFPARCMPQEDFWTFYLFPCSLCCELMLQIGLRQKLGQA